MENDSTTVKATSGEDVRVTDWVACFNSNDNTIVLSCTLTAREDSAGISGVGVILNTGAGATVASSYCVMSSASKSVSPALNVAHGRLNVGDDVLAVAQGECNGKHFFFEQRLTISNC